MYHHALQRVHASVANNGARLGSTVSETEKLPPPGGAKAEIGVN